MPGSRPDGRDLPAGPDPYGPGRRRFRPAGPARARSSRSRKHLKPWTYVARFKTGTPPRIDGRSVDLARLDRQDGDPDPYWFSFHERAAHPAQLPCYLTAPARRSGTSSCVTFRSRRCTAAPSAAAGPRYCPSIEDKIVKFPEAAGHQVFLEPEGLDTTEMYVNGLSTSLPPAVQLEFLRTVPGLENVRMTRPGYAIEYDYFPPTQLRPTLEVAGGTGSVSRRPGQRNHRVRGGRRPGRHWRDSMPRRSRSDVSRSSCGGTQHSWACWWTTWCTRGVDEPYRLFTSRSEFRLLLRQDNALRRLLPVGGAIRAVVAMTSDGRRSVGSAREEEVLDSCRAHGRRRRKRRTRFSCDAGTSPIQARQPRRRSRAATRRFDAALLAAAGSQVDTETAEWADIELKYAGYLTRERAAAGRLAQMDGFVLPGWPRLSTRSRLCPSRLVRSSTHRSPPPGPGGPDSWVSPSDLQSLVMEVLKRALAEDRLESPYPTDPVSRETDRASR